MSPRPLQTAPSTSQALPLSAVLNCPSCISSSLLSSLCAARHHAHLSDRARTQQCTRLGNMTGMRNPRWSRSPSRSLMCTVSSMNVEIGGQRPVHQIQHSKTLDVIFHTNGSPDTSRDDTGHRPEQLELLQQRQADLAGIGGIFG
jgi:hypothetical protein